MKRRTLATCALFALALALAPGFALAQETLFRYPLERCYTGCATVTAYVDRDPSARFREYNCTDHTYNGHQGTDFAPIGGFRAQEEGRTIVAGADGVVLSVHDGESDRCTTGSCGGGGGFGNYVVLSHNGGRRSYYAHMRRGSIRVMPRQSVRCGDALGLVGSSGNSTGPHVHFELREGGDAIDSFSGRAVCGGGTSAWVSQGAYRALPSESCQSNGVPMDAGVTDTGVALDVPLPPPDVPSSPDVVVFDAVGRDVRDEQVAPLDSGSGNPLAPDASRSDVATDTYNPARDWGGCNCRATVASRADVRGWLAVAAVWLASRSRRRQSGRLAQQRKPVE